MTEQQSLEENFLVYISDHIFPISRKTDTQKLCFLLRFSPENWQEENVDIARKMDKKLGAFNEQSINATLAEVLKKLKKQFGEEMAKHGINLDNRSKGRPADDKQSPWRIAYGWLWGQKFPYWQMDWFWQDLIQKAASPYRWLRFTTEDKNLTKGMVGPTMKKHEIVVDVPYSMHVDLDCNQKHLLLLNRGIDNNDVVTNYVVCPSHAFAPDNRLTQKKMLMPQSGASYEKEKIKFDAVGQEEYLAIVLDDSLDFPWLTPNEDDPFPIWNPERLKELWTRLAEDSDNWQAFYRSFQVVEASA